MEVYKLRSFAKWARRFGLSDSDLIQIVDEMNQGLLGDRLGAHVYKKRIALPGKGKRGGARNIIAYKNNENVYFMFGYTKNEKANLDSVEEFAFRLLAKELIELDKIDLAVRISEGSLIKVENI